MADLDRAAQSALISKVNVDSAKYFAIAFGGFIALFSVLHLARSFAHRIRHEALGFVTACTYPSRIARRLLIRKIPKFTSAGHFLTVLVYIAINLILAFTHGPGLPLSSSRNWFEKRLGWLAVVNLCFTVLLSIKNTPLAFLTGYSHERLNVLHRTTGTVTITCSILHWTTYLSVLFKNGEAVPLLFEIEMIHGMIAAGAFLVLGLFAIPPIRKRFYEVFLKVHTIMYLLVFINVGMHRPMIKDKVVWVVAFFTACYVLSRILRAAMMTWNSFGNTATLIPMDGVTKVVLRRGFYASPGSHAFITIPAVRALESHPFSISDTGEIQFRVRRMGGFTAALHDYASKRPGSQVSVIIDGPFGHSPDFKSYDRVLLVAGGVGATHSMSIALDIARAPKWDQQKIVEFVWVIQERKFMNWFTDELTEIEASNRIDLSIYITHPERGSGRREFLSPRILAERRRSRQRSPQSDEYELTAQHNTIKQPDMPIQQDCYGSPSCSVFEGRPDIPAIVNSTVRAAKKAEAIIVAACGPKGMMADVRKAVADNISPSGPSVMLANEQFGW